MAKCLSGGTYTVIAASSDVAGPYARPVEALTCRFDTVAEAAQFIGTHPLDPVPKTKRVVLGSSLFEQAAAARRSRAPSEGQERDLVFWRHRRRQVRRRRRRECLQGSGRSTSATPRSPTPAAPPSPPRSTAARCRRSGLSSLQTPGQPVMGGEPLCKRRGG